MAIRLLARALTVLLLAVSFAPDTGAQVLEDTWFKVKFKGKGFVLSDGVEIEKAKAKAIFYVNFTLSEGEGSGTIYDYTVISETSPGEFVVSSVGMIRTEGLEEEAMIGPELGPSADGIRWQIVLADEETTILQLLFMARLKTSFTKDDVLKKASFKSVAGMIPNGDSGGANVVGSLKLKAKLIDEDDLPFEL